MPTAAHPAALQSRNCAALSADSGGQAWDRNLLTETKRFIELAGCKRRAVKSKRVAGDNS